MENIKKKNYPVYSLKFAKFLIRHGCTCVDFGINKFDYKLRDYHTAIIYYFERNELLYNSIEAYNNAIDVLCGESNI